MKSKKYLPVIIATVLFSIVVMAACTHPPENNVSPTVSFSKDIQPILTTSCAISNSCHVGSYNINDHIDFTDSLAYSTITSKSLVTVADPTASLLYFEVKSGDMPQSPYPKLSATQITLILNWIKQGALNN